MEKLESLAQHKIIVQEIVAELLNRNNSVGIKAASHLSLIFTISLQ